MSRKYHCTIPLCGPLQLFREELHVYVCPLSVWLSVSPVCPSAQIWICEKVKTV